MPAKAPTDLDRLVVALAAIEEAEESLHSARTIIREMFGKTLPQGIVDA